MIIEAVPVPLSIELTPPIEWVDVWTLQADDAPIPAEQLEKLLAPDEIQRANAFRFPHLRRNYILARGCLRLLCAGYLHTSAVTVALHYGPNGKPALNPNAGLHFNLSHSEELTVFAFAWDLELGVDVEHIREIKEMEGIVQRFFCREEAQEVLAAPQPERARIFHTCWTRKEAFIKATGDGLSMPLDSFRVSLGANEPVRLLHVAFDPVEANRWTLQNLSWPQPYAGALCYRSPARPLSIRNLNSSIIRTL